jgi:hypothetical protein
MKPTPKKRKKKKSEAKAWCIINPTRNVFLLTTIRWYEEDSWYMFRNVWGNFNAKKAGYRAVKVRITEL